MARRGRGHRCGHAGHGSVALADEPPSALWDMWRAAVCLLKPTRLTSFRSAGFAEIGGGWLVWQWLRVGRPWPFGLVGALVLVAYGVIPTFQGDPNFGRVYAAYGGVFIVLSLVWGRLVDRFEPDRWDILGAGICLLGVLVILLGPRGRS
jgi:small multidrug resistance family-3 protein